MRRIPKYIGEFGLEIYFRVPVVYAMGKREQIAVQIESGKEALYPSAAVHLIVEREPETTAEASRRRGGVGRPKISGPVERFVPEPYEAQGVGDPDVVICPRKRLYGESKNWNAWPFLALELAVQDLWVFAAGAADSSYDVMCNRAWHHDRPLDATIEAMRRTRLVIATDAGLAHLAVLCGAPLLVVTYRGLVAPGPVIDSSGRKARSSYWRAGFDPAERVNRFEDANHTASPIEYVDGWEDPEVVVDHARRMMS